MVPGRRIDSHIHVWDREVSEYAWLTPALGSVFASWSPEQAASELAGAGMDGAILVQAEDTLIDTSYMLEVAEKHAWVLGVVGWVRLDDPAATARDLDDWGRSQAFCGVRHLINDDARADFLDRALVRQSLALLADRGLPFDIHDAWPRHLGQAERLAADLPSLTLVIDHLARPPRGQHDFADWREAMTTLARRPNTVGKLSGLRSPRAPFAIDALRAVWDFALEHFTPERLMYGSNWPMTADAGSYDDTWRVMSDIIGELSSTERCAILGGTASRVYRI
jgi:L-fuconolactonase